MNCIYEMNAATEQEVRGPQAQYHTMSGYTTLTSPSATTMMMMESAANNNNNNTNSQPASAPDPIKQSSGEMLMVSSNIHVTLESFYLALDVFTALIVSTL